MSNNGIVQIHGKDYITVAKRVEMWKEDVKESKEPISLVTEVLSHDPVVVKATVKWNNKTFTGISSVSSDTSKQIEKSNPYEVAETSAVGRALGFAGYGIIDGLATADEVVKSERQTSGFASTTAKINRANASCWQCNAPSGRPHASNCKAVMVGMSA